MSELKTSKIMDKPNIQIVLYFGIISVLSSGVFSASINGQSESQYDSLSIIDTIKNDNKLCASAKNLISSSFIKFCTNITYPHKDDTLNIEEIDTLLCLAVHDTLHKYCNHPDKPYNNITEFDMQMKTYLPTNKNDKKQGNRENFCKKLVGLKAHSKSLVTRISQLAQLLNKTEICSIVCFDLSEGTFRNPLCAVVAWSNELDNNMISNHSTKTNSSLLSDPTHNSNSVASQRKLVNQSPKQNKQGSDIVQDDKPSSSNAVKVTSALEYTLQSPSKSDKNLPMDNGQANAKVENVESSIDSPNLDAQKQLQQPDGKVQDLVEHSDSLLVEITHVQTNDVENNNELAVPDANSPTDEDHTEDKKSKDNDVKSSAIMENTQAHEETSNEDDNTHLDGIPENFDQDDDSIIDTDVESNDNDPKKGMQKSFGNQHPSQVIARYPVNKNDEESHFYTYFTVMSVITIIGYIGYHHKQKILAILLEGRRSKGNRSRRRPSTASYRKLDCTLEEAVTSQCNANVTHVIY